MRDEQRDALGVQVVLKEVANALAKLSKRLAPLGPLLGIVHIRLQTFGVLVFWHTPKFGNRPRKERVAFLNIDIVPFGDNFGGTYSATKGGCSHTINPPSGKEPFSSSGVTLSFGIQRYVNPARVESFFVKSCGPVMEDICTILSGHG